MKKRTFVVLGLILSLTLLVSGSALAHWRGGYGMMGWGGDRGPGDCYRADVDTESLIKFQKETLPLRDEMLTKRLELSQEYDKETPDTERIAQLRKDMIDLQAKIQKVAEKYDLGSFGRGKRSADRDESADGYGCGFGRHRGRF